MQLGNRLFNMRMREQCIEERKAPHYSRISVLVPCNGEIRLPTHCKVSQLSATCTREPGILSELCGGSSRHFRPLGNRLCWSFPSRPIWFPICLYCCRFTYPLGRY